MDHLSSLPAINAPRKKREQSVTPFIVQWFKDNYPGSVALEVKATKTRSIPESALMPHQKSALLEASSMRGIGHKIADTGRRLPFDAFVLKNTPAFVVACFTADSVAFAIPVEEWRGVRLNALLAISEAYQLKDQAPSARNILRIPLRS